MLSSCQSKSGADAIALDLPGMDLVAGAIDSHVHCCPHINARTVTVFDAVRQAARARMRAIGLMDVFANTSGLAALASRELGDLGVEVFGRGLDQHVEAHQQAEGILAPLSIMAS
jgi:hypothetical protein